MEAGSGGDSRGACSGGADHEVLPFDMPKLRRKLRAASSESSSTSQSSEPQDAPQDAQQDAPQAAPQPLLLQDLPFDMPKLRKKLSRSSESSSISQSDPLALAGELKRMLSSSASVEGCQTMPNHLFVAFHVQVPAASHLSR